MTSADRRTNEKTQAEGRSGRWIALAIGIPALLLLLAFISLPFLVRDESRLNVIGPIAASPALERGGVRFAGTVHLWQVDGRLGSDAQGRMQLAFDLLGPSGQPPPQSLKVAVALDMPGREMEPLRPRVSVGKLGAYSASAVLPETGQWRLRLEVPEVTGILLFTIDP